MPQPLLELYPAIPYRPLGVGPSPVEQHAALAASLKLDTLLIKRDDQNGPEFGGNKLRALEFLLPHSGLHPVTMGGYGSTWCAALATVVARLGGRASLALFPQPWSPAVAGLLSTSVQQGDVYLARSRWSLPAALLYAALRAQRLGTGRWIAAGGANGVGVLGSINAALEFVHQVDALGGPRPEAVVVPLGSGGTAAGLLLGFQLAGWKVDLVTVRVADAWVANTVQVHRLAARTSRLLRRYGPVHLSGEVTLRLISDQLGQGYGHPTVAAAGMQARFAAAGIELDPTYSAKTAAALTQCATRYRHLCFWHTFDGRLLSPPLSEHPLLRRAQANTELLWRQSKST